VRTAVAAFTLTMALVVVGLTSLPSGATPGPHKAQTPKKQYLAAASKLNTAQTTFNALSKNATISIITKAALNLATAFATFSNALKHIHFTRNAEHDVRSLETHMLANAAYLRSVTVQTSSTIASWASQYRVTSTSATMAINAVRHDLGLPVTTYLPSAPTTTTTLTTPTAPLVSPPSTSQPPLGVQAWVSAHDTIFNKFADAVSAWVNGVQALTANGDTTAMAQGCQILGSVLQEAAAIPPIPDADAQSQFAAGLNYGNMGYRTGCTGSTDFNVISEAHGYLAQADDDLLAASDRTTQLVTSGAGG